MSEAPENHGYRVLFVDDESRVLEGLHRMLHAYDKVWQMTFLTDPREALDVVEAEQFHAVVSDMRMPGMNGVELLTEIRRRSPNTARIMLTGHADIELVQRAVNEGEVYRFLTKPCIPFDLIKALCDALELSALKRESGRMLKRFREQNQALAELEAGHPVIAKVRKDASGAMIVDEEDLPDTVTDLVVEIRAEIDRSDSFNERFGEEKGCGEPKW